MRRLLLFPILLCLPALWLTGCNPDYEHMAKQRLAFSKKNQGDIHIAAIQDTNKTAFLNGILLAAEEINQRPGKLLGRNVQVHIEQDGEDFESSKSTIRRITANPKITAVLGHRQSGVVIPASVIYERSQVIFMPPFSTAKGLTGHNFQYVFRMIPGNTVIAEQLSSVAKTLGYQKIVLLYARDEISRELAFLVEDTVIKQNIEIISSSSFFEKESNYRPIISEFSSKGFDAVFIAAPPAPAATMVRQLREMGVNQPVLGSDLLNSKDYLQIAGESSQNTIIPDVYSPQKNNPIIQNFIKRYQDKYSVEPDFNAAQGYDSLMLLAAGIEKAGSTLPTLLSSTLHYMPAWVGVTGIHAFTGSGELRGKKYFFKVWQNNAWHPLPSIEIPYLLGRFEANLEQKQTKQSPTPPFSEIFAKRMDEDDHKIFLLVLAQKILQFKRIGIIYENTEEGRKAAGYPLLEALSKHKKVQITECEIAFSLLGKEDTERALVACYGKLSLNSDALFIPSFRGIDAKLLQRLNRSLTFFKIPAVSLDESNTDPHITLVLNKRANVNQDGTGEMQVYSSLLKNLKVHELAERLKGLPEISVNLANMQRYGLPDRPILLLSPDHYLQSDDLTTQGANRQ
ncbi:MAG: ABC transporter substrate-binding protein [Thiothrix litoralis]|jgi:ABC-type branched-subunit amino acid transport system substrate-binding protein|uniref:ABC transporter substrate-binding protein n=1 Tax=Thiothrix litoralis TaxID=2891210 RepID=UPI003C738330